MNLRKKTLIVMGSSILLLIVILYAIAQIELSVGISKLEQDIVRKDAERASNAVSNELNSMQDLANYWATRNDTFAFLNANDPSFIQNNIASGTLEDRSLSDMEINLLLFMDSYGQIVFGKYLDVYGNNKGIPNNLSKQLSSLGFCVGCLDKQSKYSGIILLFDQPMLIVTNPVTNRAKKGVSAGRVVLGRYLTDKEVSKLSEITQLNLTIKSITSVNLPEDYREAKLSLVGNDSVAIRLLDRKTIAGYTLLNNIYGNPILILRVNSPRALYRQGMSSLQNFLILFSAAGIFLLILTIIYIDKSVLSRLGVLTAEVSKIGKSKSSTFRLEVKGKDELSGLATSINGMLAALKQANDDLIKSEKRYKAVVEEQSDLILRNLIDGTITFANEGFCKFFSCGSDEIVGKKIGNLIPIENVNGAIVAIGQLSPDRPTLTFESQFSKPEGERWFHWTSHGIFNESGSLVEIQSVGRDITDLKAAEEALKQSERRLSDIIEFIPDPILAIDLDGRVIVWNKAMESLTHVKAEDMLGKGNYEHALPFYGFRKPILADMVLRPNKDLEAEYASFQNEEDAVLGEVFIPNLGANGSYLLAKAAILYNAEGNKVGSIESIRDITERRNIEQKLERTRTELHIAAAIQKSFIPKKTPEIPGFEIEAITIPAMEVGGDFYDFIAQPKGDYGIVIADVAGKSIPAALFMALSRTIVRANATNQSQVAEVIKNANKMIASDASAGMFVTLLYGILDWKSLSFYYANAGHLPPLLFRAARCIFEEEPPNGIALGVTNDAEYEECCIKFAPGDMAIFYTDGVTEAMNNREEVYGLDRMIEVIKKNNQDTIKDILKKMLIDISDFSQSREQHDDITLIIIKALDRVPDSHQTKFVARKENIPKIIGCMGKRMSNAGFNEEEILELQVAVEEACVNIINHGYHGGEGDIWISFDFKNGLFMATLEDESFPFDPISFNKPKKTEDLLEQPVGGWGIGLIKSLTDVMEYYFTEGRNRLILVKRKKMPFKTSICDLEKGNEE